MYDQTQPALPGEPERSPRSYTHAVIISAVFGFIGLQHFYLGRWAQGLFDLALTAAWIYCFATGQTLIGGVFLGLDIAHALGVTIALLIGSYSDGEGRLVCYPGQKLKRNRGIGP